MCDARRATESHTDTHGDLGDGVRSSFFSCVNRPNSRTARDSSIVSLTRERPAASFERIRLVPPAEQHRKLQSKVLRGPIHGMKTILDGVRSGPLVMLVMRAGTCVESGQPMFSVLRVSCKDPAAFLII